jgi:hypothetical protein
VQARDLDRLEGSGLPENRIEQNPTPPLPCPPTGSYHNQMVLSNAVVDRAGVVRVLLLNPYRGTAQLACLEGTTWTLADLPPPPLAGYWYTHVGQLACDGDKLIGVLTIGPTGLREWGADRTSLVRLEFNGNGEPVSVSLVRPPEEKRALWLPSLERARPDAYAAPALLYTGGIVAARGLKGANNINTVETEVVLEIPAQKKAG